MKENKNLNESNSNISNNYNEEDNSLAPYDKIPQLKKEGYKCQPNLIRLSRMTSNELKNVKNFKIYNKYGAVEFKEPINLYGINLDDEITIEQNLIETKDNLDYNAEYMLVNFKLNDKEFRRFKETLEKYGGRNIRYDRNNLELRWEYKRQLN